MRGKLITLEGMDGAGKSTHLEWLARALADRGIRVTATREPGGTPLGEKLREIVLAGDQALHPETETLLMFAARREHIDKTIAPALAGGTWVLCDRFTDATYAYQSGGSGVDWGKIALLEQWVHPDLQPDLTILFDVTPEVGRQRAKRGRAADRFEGEALAFFQHVMQAYRRRAEARPDRMRIVDANRSLPEVRKELEDIVSSLCSTKV